MVERNDAPVQQWLEVYAHIDTAKRFRDASNSDLIAALEALLSLLEPGSVREARRADDAVLEFVEGDE